MYVTEYKVSKIYNNTETYSLKFVHIEIDKEVHQRKNMNMRWLMTLRR